MKTNLVSRKKISYNFYPPLSLEANAQETPHLSYLGMKSLHREEYEYSIPIRKLKPSTRKKIKHCCLGKAQNLSDKNGENNETDY